MFSPNFGGALPETFLPPKFYDATLKSPPFTPTPYDKENKNANVTFLKIISAITSCVKDTLTKTSLEACIVYAVAFSKHQHHLVEDLWTANINDNIL